MVMETGERDKSQINRREFLRLSGLCAAGLAGCAAPPAVSSAGGIIDAHVHVWTPEITAYPLWQGYTRADMQPPGFTPEQLFEHCRPEGVEKVVLIQMSYYRFDNSYMLDCMKQYPGVFAGVGLVDWFSDRPDEQMKQLAGHGVRGFRITLRGAKSPDTWVETPAFERMFRFAADHELAICPLMNLAGLPSLERMCMKHPDTMVVIDHFCRIGTDGKIRDADIAALAAMAQYPRVHVKVSAFYALGQKRPPHSDLEPMIRRMHAAFGADRLMWGSDCPFAVVGETYSDSLALVRDGCTWLSRRDRLWMLERTAEKIFFP